MIPEPFLPLNTKLLELMRVYKFTKEQKGEIIEKAKKVLLRHDYVCFAYVFGSFLDDIGSHDIDIVIYICPDKYNPDNDLKIHIKLGTELEKELNMPVDTVILNSADPILRFNVLKGRLIFTRNETLHDEIVDYYVREFRDFELFLKYQE